MAAGIRRSRTLVTVVALVVLFGSVGVAVQVTGQGSETPRRGGVLLAAIGADAPGLDPHQEQTFATLQPVAPLYSTLLQIDPYSYPNVIGDVASEWKISPDGDDVHVQDPSRHPVPRRLAADLRRRQGQLRQDHLPAGRGAQHPEGALLVGGERRGAGPEHRGVQAQVPVGLPPDEPGLAVERHLPQEVPRQGPELLQEQRRSAPGPSSSRATRAGRPSRASGTPTTSSRTGRTSTGTSSSSARRRPCARRPSGRAAPTSSFATCPRPKWSRSRSSSATRWSSSRPPSSSTSTSPSTTP